MNGSGADAGGFASQSFGSTAHTVGERSALPSVLDILEGDEDHFGV